MKKFMMGLIIGIFLLGLINATQQGQGQVQTQGNSYGEYINGESENEAEDDFTSLEEDIEEVKIEQKDTERQRLKIRNAIVHTTLGITQKRLGNKTRLMAKLSNGRNAEIKIMPDTASEKALARLRLKVCNESSNCTIELKEAGKGNETRLAYEIQAERHAKILWLFRAKLRARAEIDAETGEVLTLKKSWWAFLATEAEEEKELSEE